jgi:hypothetical protein
MVYSSRSAVLKVFLFTEAFTLIAPRRTGNRINTNIQKRD